jgi:hypothetical protein
MYAIIIVALADIAAGVYIVRVEMYRTLRLHGIEPSSRGWLYAGSRSWILKYREVCVEHGLSLRYWKLLRMCVASSAVLIAIWLGLVAWQFWHDMLRPLSR